MMRRSFVLLASLALFLAGSPAKTTDYVLEYIYCPSEGTSNAIKVDFVKHIGSDPTFTEGSSGSASSGYPTARFHGISRDGQKISCAYVGQGIVTGRSAVYSKRVHRKILDCKRMDQNHLECRLEP